MTRWNLSSLEIADWMVRAYSVRSGLKMDNLCQFVDDAVRVAVLRRLVKEVQAQNTGWSSDA